MNATGRPAARATVFARLPNNLETGFTLLLRAHIASEERTFLTRKVLRDDLVP